jgi:hypothetical protein
MDEMFPIQVIERDGDVWVNVPELVAFLRACAEESGDEETVNTIALNLEQQLVHASS